MNLVLVGAVAFVVILMVAGVVYWATRPGCSHEDEKVYMGQYTAEQAAKLNLPERLHVLVCTQCGSITHIPTEALPEKVNPFPVDREAVGNMIFAIQQGTYRKPESA